MQFIKITSRPLKRMRNKDQLGQFRLTSTKVLPMEKT